MDNIILGIDIGGSHITAALVNLKTRSIVPGSLTRGHVNSHGAVHAIIAEWCQTIKSALNGHNVSPGKMGIAMPGPFDYKMGISMIRNQNKYDALFGLNVRELLAAELGISPEEIRFLNDAECFLGGEVFCGAAEGYRTAIGLTLGTGLGTAWYRNGEAEDAALWSHPFKGGIAEDFLATRWFIRRYKEWSGSGVKGVRELASLTDVDPKAKHVFDEFGENLALFLSQLIRKNEIEVVVLGGNIAKAYNLFSERFNKCLEDHGINIQVEIAQLGEEAALIGAASCWIQDQNEGSLAIQNKKRRD